MLVTSCTSGKQPIVATTVASATTVAPVSTTAAPAATTYPEVTIKLNSTKLPSYAPIFIADQEGYFKEYGIKIDYQTFNRTSDAIPLLASGALDVYAGSVNAGLLNVLEQQPNIKVVADRGDVSPNDGCTYEALLVRKDLYDSGAVTKPEDLKGKVVSSSNAGPGGFLLSNYLAKGGLTFDDVQISDLPTTSYLDGFANKSVDAIVAPELHVTKLLQGGNAVILAKLQDFGSFELSVLAFGKSLTVDHPDVGARFLAAYLKGVQQYNQGKTDENLKIMAAATGEDPALLKASCWLPIRSSGEVDFQAVQAFQKWSIQMKQLDTAITEEQFWDSSFLAAAKKLMQ
jgi:ABC-type nitrate/sulfonate/bicarbonate transport systems, periplasmic components